MIQIITFILIILNFNCSSTKNKVEQEEISYPSDPYWTELSNFLSGKKLLPENRFYAISQKTYYQNYSKKMHLAHSNMKANHLDKIIPWVEKNMPATDPKNPVIYPLGGADFFNLYHFYPNSTEYYMFGLEHPGDFSNPLEMNDLSIQKGLSSLEIMSVQMSQLNYFISKNMRNYFSNPYFKGVAPLILVFMTNIGLEVKYLEKVRLNEEGKLIIISDYSKDLIYRKDVVEGVRIYFLDQKQNKLKNLTFLRMYIEPSSYLDTNPKGKFFTNFKKTNIILKSAEYLFHRPNYENFVQYMIVKSDIIVQDDTGFPFRYFTESYWNIQLYGTYSKQFKLKGVYLKSDQHDLYSSYQKMVKSLPFTYGYGALRGKSQSNLGIYSKINKL